MSTVKNFNDFNSQEVNESSFNDQFFADRDKAHKRIKNDKANMVLVDDVMNYLGSFKSLSKSDLTKIESKIKELVTKHK